MHLLTHGILCTNGLKRTISKHNSFSMESREMVASVAVESECQIVLELEKITMPLYTDSILSGTTWNKKVFLTFNIFEMNVVMNYEVSTVSRKNNSVCTNGWLVAM